MKYLRILYFYLAAKSYNSSFNIGNREELYSFYASNQRGPFSNATKVSAWGGILLITIFVLCFHLYKIVVTIVFIAVEPFHYISIFNVVLPLPASDERLHAISNIVFLFLNVRDHGSYNIVYFC